MAAGLASRIIRDDLPGLAAAAIGIDMLEVHVALSREMFGPDVPASVTTSELRQLVEGVRFIEVMRANPVDKDALASEPRIAANLHAQHRRGADLPAGTVLAPEHLRIKKPGTGLPPERLSEVIGRRLRAP
jgi:N-acetylneuraminate synthase